MVGFYRAVEEAYDFNALRCFIEKLNVSTFRGNGKRLTCEGWYRARHWAFQTVYATKNIRYSLDYSLSRGRASAHSSGFTAGIAQLPPGEQFDLYGD